MKWIPLNGKKDPIPSNYYLTVNKKSQWDKMELQEIRITASGKSFVFKDAEGNEYTDCTHYVDVNDSIINMKPPKNNQ